MAVRGDDIAERLLELGVRVIKMADSLPKPPSGKHISGQVIRSATSAVQTMKKLAVPKATKTSFANSESA